MKLDRNTAADGRGKYAVVRLRRLDGAPADVREAIDKLVAGGFVTMDAPGGLDEFFVIMLKDKYADAALLSYAADAALDGEAEYAEEVRALAARAGRNHPSCKKPD